MSYPWYTTVSGTEILQGDLLSGCKILIPTDAPPEPEGNTEYDVQADQFSYDVIVMSQSCDLENDKVDLVLVCPRWPYEEFAEGNAFFKSSAGKKALRQGDAVGYHLIAGCSDNGVRLAPQVIDFRNVYGVPVGFLRDFAGRSGDRLRLMPPYREHLAQAFARFFMRIGLPVEVDLG